MNNNENNADWMKAIHKQADIGKQAAKQLQLLTSDQKNQALESMAGQLIEEQDYLLEANRSDLEAARARLMGESKLDRLSLNEARIRGMADGLLALKELPDPIGETLERWQRPNGLILEKRRVPFGLVAMIYESRPNVTVDAAGICLKTGNAVLLRGGSEAHNSNSALVSVLQKGLQKCGITEHAIQIVSTQERSAIDALIGMKGKIDLVIPRGGSGLIRRVVEGSRVPVIETGVGNCHVYVDKHADLEMARQIILNAKLQRPSVCNAIETILLNREISSGWIRSLLEDLKANGVEVRACEQIRKIDPDVKSASDSDWEEEFLDLTLAVKQVEDVHQAIKHIDHYGTKHSECIVTEHLETANLFLEAVDAAAVYHNASTRFTDGGEFGFGAEIGISTQKLHARGPMGLKELTTYKYIGRGTGQIRNN